MANFQQNKTETRSYPLALLLNINLFSLPSNILLVLFFWPQNILQVIACFLRFHLTEDQLLRVFVKRKVRSIFNSLHPAISALFCNQEFILNEFQMITASRACYLLVPNRPGHWKGFFFFFFFFFWPHGSNTFYFLKFVNFCQTSIFCQNSDRQTTQNTQSL